jgi:RecJ-like exonuclease
MSKCDECWNGLVSCDDCNGEGTLPDDENCDECFGTGQVSCEHCEGKGEQLDEAD